MQTRIKEELDEYETDLREVYPKTEAEKKAEAAKRKRTTCTRAAKAHWHVLGMGEHEQEPVEGESNEDGPPEAARRKQTKKWPCKELGCKVIRRNEDRAAQPKSYQRVQSRNAKCFRCLLFCKSVDLATGIETAMRESLGMIHRLVKALHRKD